MYMYATAAMFFFWPCINVRLVRSTERLPWCPLCKVIKSPLCEVRPCRDSSCPTTTKRAEPLDALLRWQHRFRGT
ncbi:hypothetical protein BJV78DRAFT_1250999 [Lactifluus subvellereus]|nr:hypothetical protein BJV78DRAFT_1250999 [Lactifluus subvellereus]